MSTTLIICINLFFIYSFYHLLIEKLFPVKVNHQNTNSKFHNSNLMDWYQIKNESEIDSPALLLYPDRIQHNINCMLQQVNGDPDRLFPHVKTHKMREVVQMQMAAGITKFKCATLSELEMCLSVGAKEVLVAYQLVGPKVGRFVRLVQQYPDADISSLVDNLASATEIATACGEAKVIAKVYLDIDNGMHRTGYPLNEDTFDMVKAISQIPNIQFKGLHLYDGQFRSKNAIERKTNSDDAFHPAYHLFAKIHQELGITATVISGGSPGFTPAAARSNICCSPGTTLLWDYGYAQMVSEIPFQWAALLMTRVISKPTQGIVTMDLGHKAVASENPIDKRIHFLNLKNYEVYKHSEEHLVVKVSNWEDIQVGDVFYGVPHHICPSVALHEEAHIIKENSWVANWTVIARKRKITV